MSKPSAAVDAFLSLSKRERILSVVALLAVVAGCVEFLWVQPAAAEAKSLRARVTEQDSKSVVLETALRNGAVARAQPDPLAAQKIERDQLRATLLEAETVLSQAGGDVRMGDLIRGLVASSPGLTLVSLKTMPPELFFKGTAAPASGAAAPARAAASGAAAPVTTALPPLYRHGVEVVVQGRYVTLIPYLQALEKNTRGVFWGPVKFEVGNYPDATLRITLYTLSLLPELSLS